MAWLAIHTDTRTTTRLVRIDWRTVGRIIARVSDDELDRERLDDLFEIGIDEVCWASQHRYLTLVTDHRRRKIVWGAVGADRTTAERFFDALGHQRSQALKRSASIWDPATPRAPAPTRQRANAPTRHRP